MPRTLALVLWYASQTGAATFSPWLGPLLTDAGWSQAAVPAILVSVPLGRLLGGPLWSWAADRTSPDRILRIAATVSFVAMVALTLSSAMAGAAGLVALAIVVYGIGRSPMMAIIDASTVRWMGDRYGRVRSAGSVAFLFLIFIGGMIRPTWPSAPLWLAVGTITVGLVVTFLLPPLASAAPRRPTWNDVVQLTKHRPLVLLVVVSLLNGVSLSSYDQLYAMHVESLGLPSWVTGTSFALGVFVEIGVLFNGGWLLNRFGRRGVLLVGVGAGIPRFLLTALTTSAEALIAIQALHGLQYGAFWIAATSAFAREAPPELSNSTQALLPSASYGAGPVLGMGLAWVGLQLGGSLSLHYAFVAGVSMLATGLVWRSNLR